MATRSHGRSDTPAFLALFSATIPFFSGLGDLSGGAFDSNARGVSRDGAVVVGRSISSSSSNSAEAFVWTEAAGMDGLGDFGPGSPKSAAYAASGDGAVIVGRADTLLALTERAAFRWTAATGMQTLLDSLGAVTEGEAFDASQDGGTIVGVRATPQGNVAFRWTAATGTVGLGWLPSNPSDSFAFGVSADGSVVCGISNSGTAGAVEPVRWTEATGLVGLGDVPGGIFYAIAWGISGDGTTIVGAARATSATDEMFLWTEATGFVLPDTAHGAVASSAANAASADGSIVVGYGPSGAMIWDASRGMRVVRDILVNEFGLDLSGWTLGSASDVSDDGTTIVGHGINPAGKREGWIARIPNPVGVAGGANGAPGGRLTLATLGPNPFGEVTAARLEILGNGGARRAEIGGAGQSEMVLVTASVFAADGRRVRVLFDAPLAVGAHDIAWDGRDAAGRRVAPGVFFLRVATPLGSASSKLVRIR